MADKKTSRGIYLYIDGKQVTGSVRSIQNEMRVLVKEQANMERGSKEYINAARKIAQLDTILQQHKDYQREVTQEYRKMSGAADDFEQKSKKAFSLDSIASGINKLKGAVVGFIASFTVDRAIDEFAKLDDAQANVQKYTGLTRAEIKELNKDFDSLDTRTARIRLNELAGDAGRLGIQSKKDILDFVDAANIIDVALGEDLGEGAIKSIGKLAQMFGDSDRMGLKQAMLATGSAINEVAQNSSAAEPYLVDFTNRLSGVGNQAGFTISQIIGLGSVLDQNAQQVETSATALSGLIMKIYQEPAKFAKIAGLDVKKFTDLMKKDANEALLTLLDTLGKQGGLDKLAPIFKDMNLNGARSSSILSVLAGNIERVRKEQKTATDAFAEGKSVINEYDVQNNTFSANMEKQKNVLLGYITDIGEKLAPMVLEGASAGNMLLKVITSLVSILIDNRTVILTVVAAYVAYNTAIKLQNAYVTISNTLATISKIRRIEEALATTQSAAAQTLFNKTMQKGSAVTKAYIAVTSLLSAAKSLLTGNIASARAAMIQFNTVMKSNPWGLALAAIVAVGAALYTIYKRTTEVSKATKAMQEAEKQFNTELAQENRYVRELFAAYKRTNPESEEHKRIREIIISKYGQYLKNLIDEKGNITDIGKALAIVNTKLKEQIALKVQNAALDKIETEALDEYSEEMDKLMSKVSKQIKNPEIQNEIREYLNTTLTGLSESADYEVDNMSGRIANKLREFGLNTYEGGGFFGGGTIDSSVSHLLNKVKEVNNSIQAVRNRYAGMFTELSSITEQFKLTPDDNGGGDKPDSKADKTAVQRKKVQDALLKLDKEHNEKLTAIHMSYRNGDIKSEAEYNAQLLEQQEEYEKARVDKLNEVKKGITDASVRADIDKQVSEIGKKGLEREIKRLSELKKIINEADPASAEKQAYENRLRELGLFGIDREKLTADQLAVLELLEKQHRDKMSKIEKPEVTVQINALNTAQQEAEAERAKLRQEGLISEEQYQHELLLIDIAYTTKKLQIDNLSEEQREKLTRDSLEKQAKLYEQNAEIRERLASKKKKKPIALDDSKNAELALLDTLFDEKLRKTETYEQARLDIIRKYALLEEEEDMQKRDRMTQVAGFALESLQTLLSSYSSYAQAANNAEVAAINKKYDAQIKAAGNNSARVKKIEAARDKEIAKVNEKNTEKSFKIQIAMAMASTAQSAINAYSSAAAIPVIGFTLAPIAASVATAAGLLQVAAIKKQRDAAKEGYYKGGYYIDEGYTGGGDPKQVRGYLPDGSPVHGREFIANHATTSLFSPLFDVFDEAQKHNTVSSISKRDLAKALQIPTGYYQGGYSGAAPSSPTVIKDSRYDELYNRFTDVMERLNEKMDVPFKGYVTYKGDNGIEDAQELDKKMMKNISR